MKIKEELTIEEALKMAENRPLNNFEKALSGIINKWIRSGNYPNGRNNYQIIMDSEFLLKTFNSMNNTENKNNKEYINCTDSLPEEFTPVWVRIMGHRPRKMYRIGNMFFYYNKKLNKNGNYSGIGKNVLWRYFEK